MVALIAVVLFVLAVGAHQLFVIHEGEAAALRWRWLVKLGMHNYGRDRNRVRLRQTIWTSVCCHGGELGFTARREALDARHLVQGRSLQDTALDGASSLATQCIFDVPYADLG